MHRMNQKVWLTGLAALVTWSTVGALFAQERAPAPAPVGKEVTLTGTIVDLHYYLLGGYPENKEKCTSDCIKAGVPVALATSEGLIILGQGPTGPAKSCMPLALQAVEVHGKLYEKQGVKYLDIMSVKKVTPKPAAAAHPAPPAERG
ncbi:MAG: hypothetical protein IPM18_12405 [Phycisphaerales bacterium]|nr:hypothetical protein [Phycisphaerales bacterium]